MSNPAPKRKGGRKPILDSDRVAASLVELQGNVAAVARLYKVHRSSVQELIARKPALQSVVHDAREGMLDNAESALYRAVIAGEAWAVCFFLKTQGKKRGYIERVDSLPAIEELLARLPDTLRVAVEKAIASAIQP